MAFEPRLIFEVRAQGGWGCSTNSGTLRGVRRLFHTFYGAAPILATAGRAAYGVDSRLVAWRLSA